MYSETQDTWTCPAGETLHFRKEIKETLPSGYEIHKRITEARAARAVR